MTRDLNLPVALTVCPILREADGLAMSSRNRYLSSDERQRALILSRALAAAESLAQQGETRAEVIQSAILATFAEDPDLRIDYVAVVHPDTLLPVADITAGALVAVAVWVGSTRLIDNLLLHP
jgi:pantoate--beta-alanine ligase